MTSSYRAASSSGAAWFFIVLLFLAIGGLAYGLYQSHVELEQTKRTLSELRDNQLSQAKELEAERTARVQAQADLKQSLHEARWLLQESKTLQQQLIRQLSWVRVALAQVNADIKFDQSGALINKKGQKADGVELRLPKSEQGGTP